MASSCLGDWKQVQDARFDSHLTGIKNESFYWRTKTIAHNKYEKVKTFTMSVKKFIRSKLRACTVNFNS